MRISSRSVLLGLEGFVAVGAVVGTIGLLHDGAAFTGHTVDAADLPWRSWVLAGCSLAAINGGVPVLAIVAEVRRLAWAPHAHLAVGVGLVGWIAVQVAFIGLVFALQPIMAVVGVAIAALAVTRLRAGASAAPVGAA